MEKTIQPKISNLDIEYINRLTLDGKHYIEWKKENIHETMDIEEYLDRLVRPALAILYSYKKGKN